jgi:predicted NBD/HSP70 family sugar kinase
MTRGNRTGDLPSLRQANRLRVLRELQFVGPAPQAELARKTGLSPASVSNIVADALRAGLVNVTEGVRGRRVKLVSLSPSLGLAAGIAVDHRHLTVVIGDLSSQVLHEATAPVASDAEPAAVIEVAARLTEEAVAAAGQGERLVSVGLTIPTPVASRPNGDRPVARSTTAPGWWEMLPAEWLASRFGAPACIDNEANAAALAEWSLGAGSGCRDLLYVQVGDGVGAGLILDDRMYRGGGGFAGEIGHVVLDPDGPLCRWGHRGCLEALSSGPAVLDAARATCPDVSTLAEVIARAEAGDAGCTQALTGAGTAIGRALAMAVNLLNPQRVVIGGLLMAAEAIVMPKVRSAYAEGVLPSMTDYTELTVAALGSNAGALGALALAIQALPDVALLGSAVDG